LAECENRYFAVVGTSGYTNEPDLLLNEAIIEWEESILQYIISAHEEIQNSLQDIENILATAPFTKVRDLPSWPSSLTE
jgi:hypothetical protein